MVWNESIDNNNDNNFVSHCLGSGCWKRGFGPVLLDLFYNKCGWTQVKEQFGGGLRFGQCLEFFWGFWNSG